MVDTSSRRSVLPLNLEPAANTQQCLKNNRELLEGSPVTGALSVPKTFGSARPRSPVFTCATEAVCDFETRRCPRLRSVDTCTPRAVHRYSRAWIRMDTLLNDERTAL
jgi:hypothetical protein